MKALEVYFHLIVLFGLIQWFGKKYFLLVYTSYCRDGLILKMVLFWSWLYGRCLRMWRANSSTGFVCGKWQRSDTAVCPSSSFTNALGLLSLCGFERKLILCCIEANHVGCCLVGTIRRSIIAFLQTTTKIDDTVCVDYAYTHTKIKILANTIIICK